MQVLSTPAGAVSPRRCCLHPQVLSPPTCAFSICKKCSQHPQVLSTPAGALNTGRCSVLPPASALSPSTSKWTLFPQQQVHSPPTDALPLSTHRCAFSPYQQVRSLILPANALFPSSSQCALSPTSKCTHFPFTSKCALYPFTSKCTLHPQIYSPSPPTDTHSLSAPADALQQVRSLPLPASVLSPPTSKCALSPHQQVRSPPTDALFLCTRKCPRICTCRCAEHPDQRDGRLCLLTRNSSRK